MSDVDEVDDVVAAVAAAVVVGHYIELPLLECANNSDKARVCNQVSDRPEYSFVSSALDILLEHSSDLLGCFGLPRVHRRHCRSQSLLGNHLRRNP